jgi:hypothetical protein
MDFEPHNFPAIVASVIRSDPRLAEPLKEIFAAYARNEDLEEIWSRIDIKFHQPLRLILDDLNEIDDPVSLDQEVQVLLHAIDQALGTGEEESSVADREPKKARKPAGQKKKTVKKPAAKKKAASKGKKKAAKKAVKKAAAPKKKKTAKPAKKKAAAPKKKKAGKAVTKKAARKSPASKKAKPARKKKK